MTPNFPAVDNWLDFLGNIWIGLVVIAAAAVPTVLSMRNRKTLSEVHLEVKNSHQTNLRMDVDRVIAGIDALTHDVRGLRTDLALEEDRRRQQYGELRSDLDQRTGRHRKQED